MVKSLDTRAELTEAVQSIVSFIERPREADIVTRRYGIKGEQETLEQVGETMHITRERVRQIEKATMIRIKLWRRWTSSSRYTRWGEPPKSVT